MPRAALVAAVSHGTRRRPSGTARLSQCRGAGESNPPPSHTAARELLEALQALEERFARQRREHWGPRSHDLDLLWWGNLRSHSEALTLPHPRLLERAFVLAPLAAIHAQLLTQLQGASPDPDPTRLTGQPGWPE